jgi:hypothetical protein
MNTPLAPGDLDHALEQSQLTLHSVALADLQALVTVAGKVGGGEGSDNACRQRMTLERFESFDFRLRTFVLRSNLGDVAIDELMKGGAFSLDARDKDASVDFAFDHACPGLGVGFGL